MFNILNGDTILSSATINVLLLDDAYTFSAADNFVDDIVAAEVSGGSYARQTLSNKAVTEDDAGGRAYFDNTVDTTFSGVPQQGANQIDAAAVFDNAGTDATRDILFYNDFVTPITGNGSDIQVQWHASGIAEIT
jgi:hypothetical protein